jgi:hypothetical protein
MRKSALWLAASLTIAASACVRTATNEATGAVDVDIESPTKQGEDWKGELKGQGMYTSVKGRATAMVAEGRTALTVTLESATPGATYSWDVREGGCGQNGALFGDASAFTSFSVRNDGTAGTTVQVNARLDEAKDYVVTIYAAGNDMPRTVVACGDLDD